MSNCSTESGPQISSRRVAGSALWRSSETVGTEVVSFLVFTALAHLLTPEHFGSVALASSIIALMQVCLYHGLTEALIQKGNVSHAHCRCALAVNFAMAGALIALGLALAWPVGWLLNRPDFAPIFCALLPSLLLRGLGTPLLATLRRALNFRALALRTLAGVAMGGGVALLLARHGAGPWSLVAQQWIVEIVGLVVLTTASPIKPWQLRWNRAALVELLPVALPVLGAQLLTNAARRLDTVALGLFLPDRELGIYFMVTRLVYTAQLVTQHGLGEVALVVLSSLSADGPRYRDGVVRALRIATLAAGVCFGALATAGPWLVPLVFGSQWRQASEPLAILAGWSGAGAVVSMAGVVLVAAGEPRAFQRLSVGAAAFRLLVVFVASRWGLLAVAWAAGLAQAAAVVPALAMLRTRVALSWRRLLRAIGPLTIAFCLALFVSLIAARLIDTWQGGPAAFALFVCCMAAGGLHDMRRELAALRQDRAARRKTRAAPSSPVSPAPMASLETAAPALSDRNLQ